MAWKAADRREAGEGEEGRKGEQRGAKRSSVSRGRRRLRLEEEKRREDGQIRRRMGRKCTSK